MFTFLKEKPPKGYMWSGERLPKIQTTTRPDREWPEAAQNREKQEMGKRKTEAR